MEAPIADAEYLEVLLGIGEPVIRYVLPSGREELHAALMAVVVVRLVDRRDAAPGGLVVAGAVRRRLGRALRRLDDRYVGRRLRLVAGVLRDAAARELVERVQRHADLGVHALVGGVGVRAGQLVVLGRRRVTRVPGRVVGVADGALGEVPCRREAALEPLARG